MHHKPQLVLMGICIAILFGCFANCSLAQPPKRKAIERERFREEAGTIEGAIWAFKLKPSLPGAKGKAEITGSYRVSELKIYQAEMPGGEMTKLIGVSKPNADGKTTVAEFESLRGVTQSREAKELKGKVLMKIVKGGAWEGQFVDSEGFKWAMSIKRIQE
jgi:hypothetical protein